MPRQHASWILALPLAGALLATSACSMLVSLDGYSGGEGTPNADGAAPDAPTTADGSVQSTPGDSDAAADGTAGSDASSDAAPADAGDGAPTGFCASRSPAPLFCDDFDNAALANDWDWLGTQGGSPAHDPAVSLSPPNSLLVSINPVAAGGRVYAVVAKQFPLFAKKPIHGSVEAALRIDEADTANGASATVAVFQTISSGGSASWEIQLVAKYTGADITLLLVEYQEGTDAGQQYQSVPVATHMPLGQWRVARIAFDLPVVEVPPAGANAVRLYLDGALAAQLTPKFAVLPYGPEIELGSGFVSAPSDAWKLRYENAWLDMKSP